MRTMLSVGVCALGVAALLSSVGCGGSDSGLDTVPVTGKVTMGGQPVAGATVTFQPTAADGRAAAGITKEDGTFELTTVEAGDGALAGQYQVSVTKIEGGTIPGAAAGEADVEATADDVDMDALYAQAEKSGRDVTGAGKGKAETVKHLIPERYSNAAGSGLTANVEAGKDNTFTFELSR